MQNKDISYAIELKKFVNKKLENSPNIHEMRDLESLLDWYIDSYGSSKEPSVSKYREYEMAIHNDLVKAVRHSDFPISISLIRKARGGLIQADLDHIVDVGLLSYDIYNRLTGYLNATYSDMLTCYVCGIKDRSYFMKQGDEN